MDLVRLVVVLSALPILSSIPAAGQAPKLSPQQLNQPMLNANKPIAPPVSPKPISSNMSKPIAIARPTFQRPPADTKPRPLAHGSIASGTISYSKPSGQYGSQYTGKSNARRLPCVDPDDIPVGGFSDWNASGFGSPQMPDMGCKQP